jgi:uncharacterized protein YjeT (DUF2065 family)
VFEEFMGIPAHPLFIHAAVVFVPLLVLLTVGYAAVPFVRSHIRWVTAAFAVAAPLAALVAKLSGDAFFARLDERGGISEEFYPRLEEHQDLGTITLYASIVLGVLVLALVYFVAPRAAAATAGGAGSSRAVSLVLGALALIAAGVSLYYVFRTGDTGAKAVWEGS